MRKIRWLILCGLLVASPFARPHVAAVFLADVDVKVDEQMMAPAGWIGAAVSAHGVHVAVLALKGSRNVVLIDGVEGPIFDQLLEGGGRTYNRPLNVDLAIWPPKSGPIAFSDDGTHCAYLGKV